MIKNKKTFFKREFSWVIAVLILFIIGIMICFGYRYYCHFMEQKNEKAIEDYTVNDFQLKVNEQDKELKELQDWLDTPHISDASRGLLYERMSLIYQDKGDNANYYACLGTALFYLKRAGKHDTVANIYGDLATSYLLNDSYDNAQKMLDVIYDTCAMDEIGSLQVESMVYRVQAQIDLGRGNIDRAMENLANSRACIDASHTDSFETYYYVMDDMVEAQIWYRQGEYDKVRAFLEEYRDSKFMQSDHHQVIAARSSIIPYHTLGTKIALMDGDMDAMRDHLEQVITCCETYNFQKMELDLLNDVLIHLGTDQSNYREKIYASITVAYEKLSDLQSEQYTFLTDSLLNNSIHDLEEEEREKNRASKQLRIMLIAVFTLLAAAAVLYDTWNQAHLDGLTGIANRRAFNERYRKNRKHHRKFHLVIIDVDDFKHVNDMYGHPVGDEVLEMIGKNLHLVEDTHIHSYRYGGEEFALIIEDHDDRQALELAEAVRLLIAKLEWKFGETVTVSLGMSSNDTVADQLEEADRSLYFSKENGKNTVSYHNKEGALTVYQRS